MAQHDCLIKRNGYLMLWSKLELTPGWPSRQAVACRTALRRCRSRVDIFRDRKHIESSDVLRRKADSGFYGDCDDWNAYFVVYIMLFFVWYFGSPFCFAEICSHETLAVEN
jgi:hypothetical protein